MNETSIIVSIISLVFACGITYNRVNHQGRWIRDLDETVDNNKTSVTTLMANSKTMSEDIKEIKGDVKTILKNGNK